MAKKKYSDSERVQKVKESKQRYYNRTKDLKPERQLRVFPPEPLMSHAEYFKAITKKEPMSHQLDIMKYICNLNHQKPVFICSGRNSAKTYTAAVAILEIADNQMSYLSEQGQGRDFEIVILCTQTKMYEYLDDLILSNPERFGLNRLTGKFDRLKVSGVSSAIPRDLLELYTRDRKHVCKVRRINPTERGIRGQRASIMLADECSLLSNTIVNTALAVPTGETSNFIALSTPNEPNSYFTRTISEQSPDYQFYFFSSEKVEWARHTVAMLRKELTAQEYAVEVLARVPKVSELRYFPQKSIDRCVKDCDGYSLGERSVVKVGIDTGMADGVSYCRLRKNEDNFPRCWMSF